MKKFFLAFCTIVLITTAIVFAQNNEGASKQRVGITELPQSINDSLQHRLYLINKLNYDKVDLEAYLNSK